AGRGPGPAMSSGTGFWLRAGNGREYPVPDALHIGRGPENDIVLLDDLVSRQHAHLWVENGRLLIRDEGSSNGTLVNGRALAAGVIATRRPDDPIRVGAATFPVFTGRRVLGRTAPLPVLPGGEAAVAATRMESPPPAAAAPPATAA